MSFISFEFRFIAKKKIDIIKRSIRKTGSGQASPLLLLGKRLWCSPLKGDQSLLVFQIGLTLICDVFHTYVHTGINVEQSKLHH